MALKTAVRLRIKPPKRRSPMQRLKSRLYYRKNKAKIRAQRRRYLRTHKTLLKRRRLFQRYKPPWYKRKKPGKPKRVRPPKKISVPKRTTPGRSRRKHAVTY